MIPIDLIRVGFCILFLIYLCFTDITVRKVSNKALKFMLMGGILFIIYDVLNGGIQPLINVIMLSGIVFILMYLGYNFGLFGGGDAKFLIVLSIVIPTYPKIEILGNIFPITSISIGIFTLSVLLNAMLIGMLVSPASFLYNISTLGIKQVIKNPLFSSIGHKMDISELKNKHVRLIEKPELINKKLSVKNRLGGFEITDEVILELERLEKRDMIDKKVWVTHSLPFMVFIILGFIVAVFYGDLMFGIMNTIWK